MSNDVQTVSDYLKIFRRRRLLLFGTIFVLTLAFVAAAFLWPPTYFSSGTILIEQQDVPEELVRSTVNNYAEERLQIVTQRVMTTARLSEIIERFDLYEDRKAAGEPMSELVDQFRADTSLETLQADLSDPRGGRGLTSTIAFTVGFNYHSPQIAKKVAEEIVNLYLSENARSRAEAATETSRFLARRAANLDEELRRMEQNLAEFKEQHSDSLPVLQGVNRERLEAVKREIDTVTREIRSLRDTESQIKAELALMSPFAAYEDDDGTIAAPQRLDSLQREYIALSSRYSPSHPDVARVRREIELLTGGNLTGDLSAIEEQLYELRQDLQEAQQQYSPSHPEVQGIKGQIQELAEQRESVLERSMRDATPTNPQYVQREGELNATRNQLEAAELQLSALVMERDDYESRLTRSPQVERDLAALERDYEAKLAQFRELQGKLESAELAQSLEIEERGERFALIDPPKVPQDPVSPNRTGIVLLGVVVALGAGLGLAALADSVDTTVRGVQDVVDLFHTPPLATVMYLETRGEAVSRKIRTAILAGAAVGSVAVVAVLIV